MPVAYTEEKFAEKFWERVDKTSDASGCWLWTGNKIHNGYGTVNCKRKHKLAHRVAYLLTGHIIPENLVLAHSEHCVGKRHCCNPAHLTPKTSAQNQADRIRDGTTVRGDICYNAKLTEAQVLDIRARVGDLQEDLAKEFGVSRKNISSIMKRKSWKHI